MTSNIWCAYRTKNFTKCLQNKEKIFRKKIKLKMLKAGAQTFTYLQFEEGMIENT